MYRRAIRAVMTAAVLVALPTHPAGAATAAVTIHDYYFSPSSLTITPGTTVNWAYNVGAGTATHTVTFDAGFSSGDLMPGSSYSHTFNAPGTFTYYCMYHRSSGMTGTITVTGSTPTPTPTPTHHTTPTPTPTHHSTPPPTVQAMHSSTPPPTRAPASATAHPTSAGSTAAVDTTTPSPATSVLAEPARRTSSKRSSPWLAIVVIVVLAAGAGGVVFMRFNRTR